MDVRALVKKEYLSVQKDEHLSSFLGKLKTSGLRYTLVFDKENLLGALEDKWLLKLNLNPTQVRVENFIKKIPSVSPDTGLIEAANLMYQSNFEFLPVMENNKLTGVLFGLDLLKEAIQLEPFQNLKVSDVKASLPSLLSPKDNISVALGIMLKERLEQIPVLDQGKLVGIISLRDILKKYSFFPLKREGSFNASSGNKSTKAFSPNPPELDKLPVSSFSTNYDLFTINIEDPLPKALDLMIKNKLTSLIILNKCLPAGLLLLKNILKEVASYEAPVNSKIRFVGLEKTKLFPKQKDSLKLIAASELDKLQRGIPDDFDTIIHIKEYDKGGKNRKYSINLKLEFPGKLLVIDKGKLGMWDAEIALRKSFENAKNALKVRFKKDLSHQSRRR